VLGRFLHNNPGQGGGGSGSWSRRTGRSPTEATCFRTQAAAASSSLALLDSSRDHSSRYLVAISVRILDSKSLQAALGLVTIVAMHPQNAMLETSPVLCSARPRTGEPNATFGCTEASTPASPFFSVHSINASVGPSPDEATTATWRYQRNQQFSITAVTTSSGSVAERYAYTAYGQPTILDGSGSVLSSSAINNRYTYTGREWDATLGLYHFRARWMSGLAGRFMGRDPIGYSGSPWDLYEFLGSNSLTKVDPSGKVTITCSCNCWETRTNCGRGQVYAGSRWSTTADVDFPGGRPGDFCHTACGGVNIPSRPGYSSGCQYAGSYWASGTPRPPEFGDIFWDEYTNCSRGDCISWCTIEYGAVMTACALGCTGVGPGYLVCLGACSSVTTAAFAPCWASCGRCRNP
jgi:RHS repeat-associated protein